MNFQDLDFNPKVMGGIQATPKFDNGRGASVIRSSFSYGGSDGLYELAVLDKNGDLDYSTSITDDVLGHLTEDNVSEILGKIESLPEE